MLLHKQFKFIFILPVHACEFIFFHLSFKSVFIFKGAICNINTTFMAQFLNTLVTFLKVAKKWCSICLES